MHMSIQCEWACTRMFFDFGTCMLLIRENAM